MNDNEIEELEIGLEVDNSELKESFDEAKSIIKSSINEITNILKNANIGDSLSDNVAKNLQKSIDDALKSVTKSTKNLDIKANVDAQMSKTTNVEKSVSNASGAATALGGGATLVGAQKMSVAGKDLKEGGKEVGAGATKLQGSTDKLTDGTGKLTTGAKSLSKSSNTLEAVIRGFQLVINNLEAILKNLQTGNAVTALNKYISNAENYIKKIRDYEDKLFDSGLTDKQLENFKKALDISENIFTNFKKLEKQGFFGDLDLTQLENSQSELISAVADAGDIEALGGLFSGSSKIEESAKTLDAVIDGFNKVIDRLDKILNQLKAVNEVEIPIAINDDITQKSKDKLTKAIDNVIDVDFSALNRRVQGWLDDIIDDWNQGMADVDDSALRKMSETNDKKNRTAVGAPEIERGKEEQAVMQTVPSLGNDLEGAMALLKVLDDINERYGGTLSTIKSENLGEILNNQFGYAVDGISENGYNLSNTLETIAQDLGMNFRNTFEEIASYAGDILDVDLDVTAMQNAFNTLQQAAQSTYGVIEDESIEITIDSNEALDNIQEVEDSIDNLHETTGKPIQILADNHPALDELNQVSKEVGELRNKDVDIKVNVDDSEAKEAEKEVKDLDKSIVKLNNNKTDKVQGEIEKIGDKAEKSSGKIKDLIKGLLPAIGGYLGFETLRTSITNAMSVLDSSNMAVSVFGEHMGEMDAWLKEVNETMGMSYIETLKYATNLTQAGKSMGMTTSEAMGLSQQMAEMAANFSAFRGIELEQAQDLFRDALVGSYDALEDYGIILDETTVAAYAVANGIATSADSMTYAQRAAAATEMMYYQLGSANNYLAETLNTPSAQANILRGNLYMLGAALGSCFTPILTVVLPLLNTFVRALTSVLNSVANFIASIFALFGVKISAATSAATQGVQGIGAALGGLGDVGGGSGGGGTGAAADGLDDVGESASGAAEEVKKLKGLMG